MRRYLLALSGARPEILDRCPGERGKFEGVGGAVLTTSVLATVSMTFALNSALGLNIFLAIPAALAWGLAILSLDRWLVSTMHSGGSRRWRLAVPRIVMAVLIGAVVSTPLVLQIFKSEIDAQIVVIKQARANQFAKQQQQDTIGKEIAADRKRIADLQKVITSGGDVPIDPTRDPLVIALTKQRDDQRAQAKQHYKEWQCQLYGGPTCPSKGPGVLAQASEKAYRKAQSQVDKLNGQIEKRKSELSANDDQAKQERLNDAKTELPKAQQSLDAAVQRQSDLQALFDAENKVTNGLLIRLQALNEVSGQDFTLRGAHLLLFLLFLLIECLPVTVKLMMKPGNYERILELAEKHEFREAKNSFIPSSPLSRSGTADDHGSVFQIWNRPDAEKPAPDRTRPMPDPWEAPVPSPTRPDPVDVTSEHSDATSEHSMDDERLRTMHDTRRARARTSDPSGSTPARSGTFELFPEDD